MLVGTLSGHGSCVCSNDQLMIVFSGVGCLGGMPEEMLAGPHQSFCTLFLWLCYPGTCLSICYDHLVNLAGTCKTDKLPRGALQDSD